MSEFYAQAGQQPEFLFGQSEARQQELRFTKLAAIGAVAAAVALGPAAAYDQDPEAAVPKTASAVEQRHAASATYPNDAAHEPLQQITPEGEAVVYEALAHPTAKLYEGIRFEERIVAAKQSGSQRFFGGFAAWSAQHEDNVTYAYRRAIADKHDLTLHDPRQEKEQLREYQKDPSTSFRKYFTVAQDYLSEFGVDLRLATAADRNKLGPKINPPTPRRMEASTVKRSLVGLVDAFSALPQEYVDFAMGDEDKTILLSEKGPTKLASDDKKKMLYAGLAFTGGDHNTIALNVRTGFNQETDFHELAHLADAAMLGKAMHEDPTYDNLNDGAPYREEDENKALRMDAYDQEYWDVMEDVFQLRRANKLDEACDVAAAGQKKIDQAGQKSFVHNRLC